MTNKINNNGYPLKYIKELDGIRGIAALMVIFFHFWSSAHTNYFIKKISVFGQTGVTMFFVLSGFLIGRILLNTKNDENYFKIFYIRRILRIFPLYYFFLIIFYLIVPRLVNWESINYPKWYYYFFLQNIPATFNWKHFGPSHYWSLAVEEHFYLILPLIIYYCSFRRIKLILYCLIVCAFIFRIILLNHYLEVFYFTFTTMDALALGALLSLIEVERGFRKSDLKIYLIIMLAVFVLIIILWNYANGKALLIVQEFKFFFIALTYFCFIGLIICSSESSFMRRILNSKALQYSGKISYGLYIYHPLCFLLLQTLSLDVSPIINFGIALLLIYGISALSYNLFESKVLSLKRYFTYNNLNYNTQTRY
ncbi:MAG TPA: acyltransferase [Saprospiraceae bacterium]|nr:acyltransferase [Saprospiraceae bacterium]